MTDLYNRKYELTVSPNNGTGKQFNDLQITFKISKFGDSTPNEAEISIYNLNESSRKFVDKENQIIILKAGYEGNFGQIFKGISDFTNDSKGLPMHSKGGSSGHNQKNDTDWITTIHAKDGFHALKKGYWITESFTSKTSEKAVLQKILDKVTGDSVLKLAKGVAKGLREKKFNQGLALSGSFSDVMDRITKNSGLNWNITDGTVNIWLKNNPISDTAIKLDKSTGLIGSPELTEKGLKVRSLLRYEINPGSLIYLKSVKYDGFYIVENLTHEGNFNSGDWITDLEVFLRK